MVYLCLTLFFCANVFTKLGGSFKFHESRRLVDPLADPIELDAIYNHILNYHLSMKPTHEAWRGA